MPMGPGGTTLESVAWFPGQVAPSMRTMSLASKLDILAPSLAVRNENGTFAPTAGSARVLGAVVWTLAVRLQNEWQPNYWRQVGFMPVRQISVSDTGEIAYGFFDHVLGGSRR